MEHQTTAWPTRSTLLVSVVTIAAFVIVDQSNGPLYRLLRGDSDGLVRLLFFFGVIYGSMLLTPALVGAWLFGVRRVPAALGLTRSPLAGLGFALAVTSVMLAYFALTSPLAPLEQPVLTLFQGAVMPGFGEELFYRAFLFGFLFRFARWGFLPAALLVAAVFGAAHLYQGNSAGEAAAIFAITALGAVWFAWLYVEWDFNLWVPTGFHVLMNAWWELFAVSDSALGPMGANVVRLVVIALSVVFTVLLVRRRGGTLSVRGRAWLRGD
ncbi:MAG: CPBP family intramembrane glutamic endopeptidase [Pseudomonadota bacterium]